MNVSNVITIGCVLGLNYTSTLPSVGRRLATSDQEQWCFEQAKADVAQDLSSAGSSFQIQLEAVFSQSETAYDDPALVLAFLDDMAAKGAAFVVGPRTSDTLMAVAPRAQELGITLISPSSGLPDLPSRDNIFRLWPTDDVQAEVLTGVLSDWGLTSPGIVFLSNDDTTGVGLTDSFLDFFKSAGGTLLLPPILYNTSTADLNWTATLAPVKKAIEDTKTTIAVVCNCDADEIGDILDTMEALDWPADMTQLLLSDRSTPTRLVADDSHRVFAASLNTSGVLPHIPINNNPAYTSLEERWETHGDTGNGTLFASALSTYDAIRMAARASMLLGTTSRPTPAQLLADAKHAFNATALQTWGAGGMMAVNTQGDLLRSEYDVYDVDAVAGWRVVGERVP